MRILLIVAAAVLVAAGAAGAHHAASNARVEAHHAASAARVEAHHTASDARVEAHHTASDARVEAHHTASGVALTGSAAAESAGREIVQGPHGGALVPLGDGVAVLEFTFDVTTGMFSMYVWDAALESPVFIRQNLVFLKVPLGGGQDGGVMLAPVENDMTGDTKGHASEFVGGLGRLIGREEFDVFVEWVMVDDHSFRVIPFPMPEGNGLGPGFPEVVQAAAPEGE